MFGKLTDLGQFTYGSQDYCYTIVSVTVGRVTIGDGIIFILRDYLIQFEEKWRAHILPRVPFFSVLNTFLFRFELKYLNFGRENSNFMKNYVNVKGLK